MGSDTDGPAKRARLSLGNGQQLTRVLQLVLVSMLALLGVMAMQLHTREVTMQDCVRNTEAFRTQLDALKDQLVVARSNLREVGHDKEKLVTELEDVAVRTNQMVPLKAQLKGELVQLIDKYILLKREMRVLYNQAQLTRQEALSLETQSHQVEQQLRNVHYGLRSLDMATPAHGHGHGSGGHGKTARTL